MTCAGRSVKRANSCFHWCFSEVGHTTSTRSTPKWRAMISAAAMAWTVLPSPISSPIRQRPAVRRTAHLRAGRGRALTFRSFGSALSRMPLGKAWASVARGAFGVTDLGNEAPDVVVAPQIVRRRLCRPRPERARIGQRCSTAGSQLSGRSPAREPSEHGGQSVPGPKRTSRCAP